VPVPSRHVRPGFASLIADNLTDHQVIGSMARSETSHCSSGCIPPDRQWCRAIAAAAKTVGGRVKTAGRRVEPSDDYFAPAVGKTANMTGEIPRKGHFALREWQLGQRESLIVRGPATKARAGGACRATGFVDERSYGRSNSSKKKGEYWSSGSQCSQRIASLWCSRVRTHRIAIADRPNATMPMPSCHQPGAFATWPAST